MVETPRQAATRIVENIVGGALWGLVPIVGFTTNYAETALDELALLGTFIAGEGIANELQNNIHAQRIVRAVGAGALGLLSWDIGQVVGYKPSTS